VIGERPRGAMEANLWFLEEQRRNSRTCHIQTILSA
jgi:hypothetical protein